MALVRNRVSDPRVAHRAAVNSVYELDGKVNILMEMPGVETGNLDVRIEENQLIVDGEPAQPPEGTLYLNERQKGAFHMVFTIDETIDRDRIEANLKNGVLRVVLERKEAERPRRIEVKAG